MGFNIPDLPSIPVPTPEEALAIGKGSLAAKAGVEGKLQAVTAWTAAIDVQSTIDGYYKRFQDYFLQDVLGNYGIERRFLDGQVTENPITEQDITDFTNNTGRLYNVTDVQNRIFTPERISQFDGLPLIPTDNEHENYLLPAQDTITSSLQTFSPQLTGFDPLAVTTTALDKNSTTLGFDSPVAETISINDLIFVGNGTDAFIVRVDSIGGSCSGEDNPVQPDRASCELDNGTWTDSLGITVLTGSTGTVAIGASLGQKSYTGFNNTERTNKVATDTDFQPLMNSFLVDLDDTMRRRLTVLSEQSTALANNGDDNLNPQTSLDVTDSFLSVDGFLGTVPTDIDISDVGIGNIETESTGRLTQVTDRINGIATDISNGNFCDTLFEASSARSRLDNGFARLVTEYESAKDSAAAGADTAQALADRYTDTLASFT